MNWLTNRVLPKFNVFGRKKDTPETGHAVTTSHIAIQHGQTAMPAYRAAWSLLAATPMLKRSTFLPNHVMIGQYNAVIYKGIQGVETGRLSVEEGADFIIDELQAELGEEVDILD